MTAPRKREKPTTLQYQGAVVIQFQLLHNQPGGLTDTDSWALPEMHGISEFPACSEWMLVRLGPGVGASRTPARRGGRQCFPPPGEQTGGLDSLLSALPATSTFPEHCAAPVPALPREGAITEGWEPL